MRKEKTVEIEGEKKVTLKELKMREILDMKEAFGGTYSDLFGKVSDMLGLKKEEILEMTFSDIYAVQNAFFEVNGDFLRILEGFDLKVLALQFMTDLKNNMIADFQKARA